MDCLSCRIKIESDWRFCPLCGVVIDIDEDSDPSFAELKDVTEGKVTQSSPPSIDPSDKPAYGEGVRAQVFEVIVRQAIAGAPWQEICKGPMQINNISAKEVEAEVKRRMIHIGLCDGEEVETPINDKRERGNHLFEIDFKPTSKRIKDSFDAVSSLTKSELFHSRKAMVKQKRVLTDMAELIEMLEELEKDEMMGD